MRALRSTRPLGQRCAHPMGLSRGHRLGRTAAASTEEQGGAPSRISNSITNLSSLLSQDEDDEEDGVPEGEGRRGTTVPSTRAFKRYGFYDLADTITEAPKVLPTLTFILYYDHIVLHLAGIWLDVTEGAGAGSDFTNQFVNDHLTVLQGNDWLRLVTSPLVHPSSWALLVALLGVGVLASELEGLIGYWSFGALYVLVSLFSGLVEAGADQVPITQGSLPMIAGFVGALLVTYGKSTLLEEQVAMARASPTVRATIPGAPATTTTTTTTTGSTGPQLRSSAFLDGGSGSREDAATAVTAQSPAQRSQLSPAGDLPSTSSSSSALQRTSLQSPPSSAAAAAAATSSAATVATAVPGRGAAHVKEMEEEEAEGEDSMVDSIRSTLSSLDSLSSLEDDVSPLSAVTATTSGRRTSTSGLGAAGQGLAAAPHGGVQASTVERGSNGSNGDGGGNGKGNEVLEALQRMVGAGPRMAGGRRRKAEVGEEETEAEVEFLEGLLKLKFPTTGRVQAIVALSTAALSSLEALWDLRLNAGVTASWLGITAGMVAGAFLAWGLAPNYVVERVDRESAIAAVRARQYAIKHWAYDLMGLLGLSSAAPSPSPMPQGISGALGGGSQSALQWGQGRAEGGAGGEEGEAATGWVDEGAVWAAAAALDALPSSGTDMLHLRDTVTTRQRVGTVVMMAAAVVAVRVWASTTIPGA